MKLHELKTDPELFDAVWEGRKTHEIRYNDRDFKVGDLLFLRRTKYTGYEMRSFGSPLEYTGKWVLAEITHILTGYGLQPDWCVMSIDIIKMGK